VSEQLVGERPERVGIRLEGAAAQSLADTGREMLCFAHLFVGFAAGQRPLAAMLESMAGLVTGTRDALTLYTRPLTGAYYFVPSIESLLQVTGQPD
jgi:hypothetical protein